MVNTRFLIAVLLATSCYAVTGVELASRYGDPIVQGFAVGVLSVTVEYNAAGHVVAAQIAPVGYQSNIYKPELSMEPRDAAELLDFFLPPERRNRMLNGLNCLGTVKRKTPAGELDTPKSRSSCGLRMSDKDIAIWRDYTIEEQSERDLVTRFQSKTGLPLTAKDLRARFGKIVMEIFAATSGIGTTARYDETGSAIEIVIAPIRSLLERDDQTPFIAVSDGEQVLSEVVPPWTRYGVAKRLIVRSGWSDLFVEFENLTIVYLRPDRQSEQDVVAKIIVRWTPKP